MVRQRDLCLFGFRQTWDASFWPLPESAKLRAFEQRPSTGATNVASIVPAVVLTCTGTGALYFDRLEQTTTKDEPKQSPTN